MKRRKEKYLLREPDISQAADSPEAVAVRSGLEQRAEGAERRGYCSGAKPGIEALSTGKSRSPPRLVRGDGSAVYRSERG